MELQRIETERAALRRRAAQNNEAAKAVPQNLGELGESAEHVASALGISPEQWRKLKTVFQKAQSGDAEAKELMKALDAGLLPRVTLQKWRVENSTVRNNSTENGDTSKLRGPRRLKFEQSGTIHCTHNECAVSREEMEPSWVHSCGSFPSRGSTAQRHIKEHSNNT